MSAIKTETVPCESCTYKYFNTIAKFYENEDLSREFLRAHGVLPLTVNCPGCKIPCTFKNDKLIWHCTNAISVPGSKKRKFCNFSVGDSKGTFVDNTNISCWKILLFVNHFLSHLWDHRTIEENLYFSHKCLLDWWSICANVCEYWSKKHQDPIGGEGIAVDIDETLIDRREVNHGKALGQIWLFGAVERVTKRSFVIALTEDEEPDDKNKKEILLPLIKKFILPGSVIYSASKKTYGDLNQENYTHHKINTSENSEEEQGEEAGVHNLNVEDLWFDIKRWVTRPGNREKFVNQYLARYLFIKNENDISQLLHKFLRYAGMLYKHQSVAEEEQQ